MTRLALLPLLLLIGAASSGCVSVKNEEPDGIAALYVHVEYYAATNAIYNRYNDPRVADEVTGAKLTGIEASHNTANVLSGNKAQAGKNR